MCLLTRVNLKPFLIKTKKPKKLIIFSTFEVVCGEGMQIYVKTVGETTITLNVQKSHTINHVKAVIQERLYFLMKVQRLTYEGVQLEDGMTLGHYNIQNNSTLHLEEETKKEKKSFVGLEGEKEAKEAKVKDVPFFQGGEEEEEEDFEAGPIADLFRREKEEEEKKKEEEAAATGTASSAASSSTAPLYLFPCW